MTKTVDNSPLFSKRAAFITALIWLVHPLNVEAVAYISGRGDPMSVFFILLALWLWITTLNVVMGSYQQRHSVSLRVLSIISMVLAILSRETAILFPALLTLVLLAFGNGKWANGKSMENGKQPREAEQWPLWPWKMVISVWPFWAISVGYMILRLTVLNFQNTLNFYSQANIYTEHLSYRLYTFGHALVEYFKLIFVPLGLHMERELSVNTSLFQWPVWLGFSMILLIVTVGVILYKKAIGHSSLEISHYRIWLFGFGWFFIAMAPVSGIIPINAIMYEHWLYLPLIGLVALAGFYIDKLFLVLKIRKLNTLYLILYTLFIVYFSFLGVLTIKRNMAWGNIIGFYEDILKYNPDTVRIINNLGNAYASKGDLVKSAEMYERAIQLPDGQAFAQPYYNLANTYRDQNRPEDAAKMYIKAIEVDPNFPFAYKNLAILYAKYGYLEESIKVLRDLKKIRPDDLAIDEAIRRLEADMFK